MNSPITLVVQFQVKEEAKNGFVSGLKDLFQNIQQEKTFIEAWLNQDLSAPEKLLVYEVWNETPESFMRDQMTKDYRTQYEKKLESLNVERSAAFYRPIANWKHVQ